MFGRRGFNVVVGHGWIKVRVRIWRFVRPFYLIIEIYSQYAMIPFLWEERLMLSTIEELSNCPWLSMGVYVCVFFCFFFGWGHLFTISQKLNVSHWRKYFVQQEQNQSLSLGPILVQKYGAFTSKGQETHVIQATTSAGNITISTYKITCRII